MTSLTKNNLSFDVSVDRTDFDPFPDLPTNPGTGARYIVGQTIIVDGITTQVIWVASDTLSAIAVDKNHDLSYYFTGSDYVNTTEAEAEAEDPQTINTANKYGYEWGGYGIETGITATAVGTGLSNTNSLIEMNLQPHTSGWYVVWDKIKEFRQSHSDKWFLPSRDELDLIYDTRNNLGGLTTTNNACPYYCSSSEYGSDTDRNYCVRFIGGIVGGQRVFFQKFEHNQRSRLCVKLGS